MTINKYLLNEYDVIELGSSIGIVSSYIRKRTHQNRQLICVEANPSLLDIIGKNIYKNTQSGNFKIINKPISYTKSIVPFKISLSNNTDSHAASDETQIHGALDKIIELPSIQLNKILSEFNIKEYVLVSDIEGAEIEILLYDTDSLTHCKQIIAELHTINYMNKLYAPSDMQILIEALGFVLQSKHGFVYNFIKKN